MKGRPSAKHGSYKLSYLKYLMPTRITEVQTPDTERTTLRVEGTLRLEHAELLENICRDLKRQSEGVR